MIEKKLEEHFGYNKPFTLKQLTDFYNQFEDNVNPNTIRWRIYNLKKQGRLTSIKRGVYILEYKKSFTYNISSKLKRIFNIANNKIFDVDLCIWNTSILHSYMNHQPFNGITILEVDKDVINIVFNILKEKKNNVYLNPDINQIRNYILDEDSIIVKPLLKEAPIEIVNNVQVPKIEKILVDVFFEKELLIAYQGKEMENIFNNIFEEYTVNLTTLYRYAKNRGIKQRIQEFLIYETDIKKKYICEEELYDKK